MDSELRYVAQLTFTHDPLIGLVDAFHLILKFAVTFWQFFSNDVCASWNIQARGGSEKHSLTDLELISRHGPHLNLFVTEHENPFC